ncbi:right-handed parallel beta-helix repeat-containing protein [Paraflavitalea speifideaquila]|uniref:right-handed parallel beta-helix repeat-containing protein n=1 Tax=Paraflavitalea speifideaquila TaxID=3076558 RepID=UPI0028ED89DE|nr:right-handed parallel beta-helix repeat-containing protein [Paraflavitalea speifideiaquila]
MKKITPFILLLLLVSNYFVQAFVGDTTSVPTQQLPGLKPILDAQKNNPVITIPPGTYLLNNLTHGAYQFSNLNNVTINGYGASIICNSQELAFKFYNCTNITVSGFSIDYDPLCFTQGTIVAKDAVKNLWFEVEIDEGYAVDQVKNTRVQFYDPATRQLKNSITTGEGHYAAFEKIGTNRFKLTKQAAWVANEAVGDLVVLDVVSTKVNPAAHAFQLEKCQNATVQDITIYGSNSFSFFERNCSASHYNRCKVLRGPVPAGIKARLRSGNADGIHSSLASIGPLVENCEVKHNGDDCIIVCGRSFPVCKIDSATQTIYVLSREANPVFYVGDTLQQVLYAGVKGGQMKIQSVDPYVPTAAEQQAIVALYPDLLFKTSYTKGARIKLDSLPGMGIGDVVYNENHTGKGFVIRNNKVGYNRSRGILIKSGNGLVHNNEITGTAMNGILVGPEIHWMGGGFAYHVEIKYNRLSECMFEKTNQGMPPGVLSVFCANGLAQVPLAGAFSQINVHHNTIQKSPYPGIVCTSVLELQLADNEVIPYPCNSREHGKRFGVTFSAPIWEKNNTH